MHFPIGLLALLLTVTAGKAQLKFSSSNAELNQSFAWAREKALSFAHDGSDPVGFWYEAALPGREAFCMRDVSHQAMGAEILGLGKHNENMFLRFAENISEKKDYCSYWEINRYNKPAPVDFQNDKDFWYNLPANFDVIYNAYRLYRWTGNKIYLEHPALRKFYGWSMKEYVDHWDLGYNEVAMRNRSLHSKAANRFTINRGIPTYNEGGRGETLLGIDLTASLIAAYRAYSEILRQSGEGEGALVFANKAKREEQFLEEFWWDKEKKEYRSIQYSDKSFDYFMVGENQAFLHYPIYFGAIQNPERVNQIIATYREKYPSIIIELKSYLPILFYERGYTAMANQMIVELCDSTNKRRDYPENAFTIMEHFTRGLMGIDANAETNKIVTQSRLGIEDDWAELDNVSVLGCLVSVKHSGTKLTSLTNHGDRTILWEAQMHGKHASLLVNGELKPAVLTDREGDFFSSVTIPVKSGTTVTVGM